MWLQFSALRCRVWLRPHSCSTPYHTTLQCGVWLQPHTAALNCTKLQHGAAAGNPISRRQRPANRAAQHHTTPKTPHHTTPHHHTTALNHTTPPHHHTKSHHSTTNQHHITRQHHTNTATECLLAFFSENTNKQEELFPLDTFRSQHVSYADQEDVSRQ